MRQTRWFECQNAFCVWALWWQLSAITDVSRTTPGNGNRIRSVALALDRSPYYQRYPSYPPYCSDPGEMATRGIPPLPVDETNNNNNNNNNNTRLVHVTAVIRHGARTPVHSKNCWKGHWDEPDGVWDCDLTTLLSTRPNGNSDSRDDRGQFLVEKIYDAFLGERPPSPYRNRMNGTCQDGQLLQQGYDQQISNGRHLRDAYVVSGSGDPNPDSRLELFGPSSLRDAVSQGTGDGSGGTGESFLEGLLRYRSDDDQRTLASGQVLLSSMFAPELASYRAAHGGASPVILHHTADRPRDIMSSRKGKTSCPSQEALIDRSYRSKDYKAFAESEESRTMERLIENELEPEGVSFGGLDCMMTSICTDRSLPDVLADYGGNATGGRDENDPHTKAYGPNRFQRLLDYVVENSTFASRFNDSELSKDDMGPFWAEVMDYIIPVITKGEEEKAVKFALYSGHDSTILPMMASLGRNVWNATNFPAYASMMIIEIHEITDRGSVDFASGYAFRLVYNGRVLTWLMDGCPEYSQLCDVSVFVDRVRPFATRKNMGCGIDEAEVTDSEGSSPDSISPTPSKNGDGSLSFLILCMVASFVFGGLLTGAVMQCCRWNPRNKQRDQSELIGSGRESSIDYTEEPDIVID